jgi:hypothetical protein
MSSNKKSKRNNFLSHFKITINHQHHGQNLLHFNKASEIIEYYYRDDIIEDVFFYWKYIFENTVGGDDDELED